MRLFRPFYPAAIVPRRSCRHRSGLWSRLTYSESEPQQNPNTANDKKKSQYCDDGGCSAFFVLLPFIRVEIPNRRPDFLFVNLFIFHWTPWKLLDQCFANRVPNVCWVSKRSGAHTEANRESTERPRSILNYRRRVGNRLWSATRLNRDTGPHRSLAKQGHSPMRQSQTSAR